MAVPLRRYVNVIGDERWLVGADGIGQVVDRIAYRCGLSEAERWKRERLAAGHTDLDQNTDASMANNHR